MEQGIEAELLNFIRFLSRKGRKGTKGAKEEKRGRCMQDKRVITRYAHLQKPFSSPWRSLRLRVLCVFSKDCAEGTGER